MITSQAHLSTHQSCALSAPAILSGRINFQKIVITMYNTAMDIVFLDKY